MARLNVSRMIERIEYLATISATAENGVTRFSFTDQSERANDIVQQWMEEAGMKVHRDGVNNLIGRYEGTDPYSPVLMIGSHIDSVKEGGKYDGVLGVIAGIEVVTQLFEREIRPNRSIEVVAFCDEEGARFHTSLIGSRAMAGQLTDEDLQTADEQGITLSDAMRQVGLDPANYASAKRDPKTVHSYLELHIEQGPILQEENQPCGVVMGIAGALRYNFCILGMAGHAGTVPMSLRKDALTGTAEMMMAIEQIANQYPPLVATVGRLNVQPGVGNVIPGTVVGTLDIRDTDEQRKLQVASEMLSACEQICRQRGLESRFELVTQSPAVRCSPRLVALIENALIKRNIKPLKLQSGAGHDAMAIAGVCDVGMIFVRCKDGVSHHPDEYASPSDIETATEILFDVVLNECIQTSEVN
ncbi:allantoate amidohydrolase [Alicyclobacillus pomorum]|uniref:allantoate amidohydrolase n=1 Tax=Alicyclobacillus pomorum TaxID=204470 RepID=UPI00047D352D|nr:allantoate amidohydrolase [Alicyclobacillus pomorum]